MNRILIPILVLTLLCCKSNQQIDLKGSVTPGPELVERGGFVISAISFTRAALKHFRNRGLQATKYPVFGGSPQLAEELKKNGVEATVSRSTQPKAAAVDTKRALTMMVVEAANAGIIYVFANNAMNLEHYLSLAMSRVAWSGFRNYLDPTISKFYQHLRARTGAKVEHTARYAESSTLGALIRQLGHAESIMSSLAISFVTSIASKYAAGRLRSVIDRIGQVEEGKLNPEFDDFRSKHKTIMGLISMPVTLLKQLTPQTHALTVLGFDMVLAFTSSLWARALRKHPAYPSTVECTAYFLDEQRPTDLVQRDLNTKSPYNGIQFVLDVPGQPQVNLDIELPISASPAL